MRRWCIGAIVMAMLAAPALAACPNKCSGHGRCVKNDVCDCMQNWTGGDCSGRVCPFTRAWQDTAEGDDDAHYYAECGNRGVCDREKGICDCDAPFGGSGCRRLECPNDCSGHGTCEFIEELAADGYYKRIGGVVGRTYTQWDQEKIMGCRCDPGFEGYNCARRVCPKGDDPLTTAVDNVDTAEMIQAIAISVTGAAVTGFLTYHDPYGNAWITERIAFITTTGSGSSIVYHTCDNIQTALRQLPNNVLNSVEVEGVAAYRPLTRDTEPITGTPAGADVPATAVTGVVCLVSFKLEPGTSGLQNLLECDVSDHDAMGQHPKSAGGATTTCTVHEHTPDSTKDRPLTELAECSNRGTCDYATGVCKCFTGHMGLACQAQEALV